jgi:hypothetical protein
MTSAVPAGASARVARTTSKTAVKRLMMRAYRLLWSDE